MDIDDIRTFVEIASGGGISVAARRLGVSKSIVSRQLSRLEGELGGQLLSRTTRGAALTEAGIAFRDHAIPKKPEDPAEHRCLLEGTETWRFLEECKAVSVHPRGRFKADNGQELLSAALAGLGIAALPDYRIKPHIASGALVALLIDH